MSPRRPHAPFALALLAATCLTPVAPAQAAPGERIGPEFQVNTATAGWQTFPSVAMDADGNFVVVWHGCTTIPQSAPNTDCEVFAQRYDASGEPAGGEFQVNSTTTGDQMFPVVAIAAGGDFVVAWEDRGFLDGSGSGVFARRYSAAGEPQGEEFPVNDYTSNSQGHPAIAMDADGDFIVTWAGYGPGDDSELMGSGIFARRFDAAGEPQDSNFRVNTTTTDVQGAPSVAMDADGDFVVVWHSWGQDGDGPGVYAQRFDATGVPQGGEFRVNATTTSSQEFPSIAMDADGEFVVAWQSYGQDGSNFGIFAQRYSAAGVPQGPEFQVNSTTTEEQSTQSIAMDAGGSFVVAWHSLGLNVEYGLYAQRFNATGEPQGGEFSVRATNTGSEGDASLAMDADGDIVVAWNGFDGDGFGIYAQRFDGVERVEGDFDGDGKGDLLWRNTVTGQTLVWLMDGETRLATGPIGTVPTAWKIAGTGDFNGDGKADILWRNSATGAAVVWQMNGLEKADSASIGAAPLAWSVERLRDTDGDGLSDIVWRHGGTGKTLVWRMSGFTRVAAEPIGSVGSDWQLR